MSAWVWLVRPGLDGPLERHILGGTASLIARVPLTWPDGHRETLAALSAGPRPHRTARRADAALIDPAGPATRAVVQWLDDGREPLFDDPAVQHVLRLLAAWPGGPVSTLTRDSVRYCGAIRVETSARNMPHGGADGWPLRLLGAAPTCEVGAGLLARRASTVHGTQRSGGSPWPAAPGAARSWRGTSQAQGNH